MITKEKNSLAMVVGGAGFFFFLLLLFFLRTKQCGRCHRKSPIDSWGWKRRPREGGGRADLICPQCYHEQAADAEERVKDWVPKRNDPQITASTRETFLKFKQGECFTIGLERLVEWNGIYLSDDLLEEMAQCADVTGQWQSAPGSGDTTTITKAYPCEHLRSAARWAIRQRQKYTDTARKLGLLD
jgi:hypothetical protein